MDIDASFTCSCNGFDYKPNDHLVRYQITKRHLNKLKRIETRFYRTLASVVVAAYRVKKLMFL